MELHMRTNRDGSGTLWGEKMAVVGDVKCLKRRLNMSRPHGIAYADQWGWFWNTVGRTGCGEKGNKVPKTANKDVQTA
jgi:hypothetical protein